MPSLNPPEHGNHVGNPPATGFPTRHPSEGRADAEGAGGTVGLGPDCRSGNTDGEISGSGRHAPEEQACLEGNLAFGTARH